MTRCRASNKVLEAYDRVAPAIFGLGIGLLIIGILIKKDIKYSILKAMKKEGK